MQNNISKQIIATLAYYDISDFPLTAFEVWKYLISRNTYHVTRITEHVSRNTEHLASCSLADIINELESEEVGRYIEEFQGFYFLKGRKNLVGQRLERNKISEEKYKIILRTVKILKFIPYIKMVAVVGRVAMKNSEEKSDLDLLLVFEKKHIFLGRFLSFILLNILGVWRKGRKIKNRICLNHFLSDEFDVSVKDLFSSHEYVFMLPVFGFETYQKFLEKNGWIRDYRPNFSNNSSSLKEEKDNRISKSIRTFFERIFNFPFIENGLKKIQVAKIEANPKTQKAGGVIIYTDGELSFWPDFEKQGPLIFSKFQKKMMEMGMD